MVGWLARADGRGVLAIRLSAPGLLLALAAALCPGSPAYSARNVILMIGDGMGYEQVDAGSYYLSGAGGSLCFEPYYKCGVTTYSLDSSVTDSAAAGTALATGHKTNNGIISQSPSGTPYETILEAAKSMDKRTGLVTTVPITHATPAAFGAHEPSRNNYSNIGYDYLNVPQPEVIFGGGDPNRGGSGYFTSSHVATAQSQGYTVVYNAAQMWALDAGSVDKALGLFAGTYMTYEYDRTPSNTEPHLSEMTERALSIMSNDPDGFFLMVEGGRIDNAGHSNDIARLTEEVVEFHNAVQVALDWIQGRTDTLLIVTADHETGGLTATNQGIGSYAAASWSTGGHTGANVPLYAVGPDAGLADAHIVGGEMDNTDVYRVMMDAYMVPEPGSMAVVALGIAGLVIGRRRRSGRA